MHPPDHALRAADLEDEIETFAFDALANRRGGDAEEGGGLFDGKTWGGSW
jgi:hypothetical protein